MFRYPAWLSSSGRADMTLEELIIRFRFEAKDSRKPYLWSDELVISFLNEAERRACICGRLLLEEEDEEICSIGLSVGSQTYDLHPKLYEIVSLGMANQAGELRPIDLRSREWLNASDPSWRENTNLAYAAIQGESKIRIVGEIIAGDELRIEGYRLPMGDMKEGRDCPEIHEAHHVHLLDWVKHKAFSVPDSDGFDPGRAAMHEDKFTQHFGPMPDSDLRRSTRFDAVQHNKAYILDHC